MQRALSLAEHGAGYTSPNPMVGCVIVSVEGNIIGEGYHERFGKAHAEVRAVKSVKDRSQLQNATVYVTLEPCSHHGKTPPCADMLCELPIKRVVVAMQDPHPNVNGKGLEKLRAAGIEVTTGVLQQEAAALNEAWLHRLEVGKPFVTLKIAQTADGYIAAPDGSSEWISCLESRTLVHRWRSRQDAVMVGRNTALFDNPTLTVRHVEGRQPRRVVIDGPFELPSHLQLFSDTHEQKTIVITHNKKAVEELADPMLKLLQSNYFRGDILVAREDNGHTDLNDALNKLSDAGITSLLVEAGGALSAALLRQNLVDRLQLFIAPKLLGGGTRSITNLGIDRMSEVVPFRTHRWQPIGSDMLLTADF